MALDDVKQAVQQQAEEEARRILDDARRKTNARWERESARLRDEHEHRVAAMESGLDNGLERELSARVAEHGQQALKVKNEILDAVFAGAAGRIRSLPDDGYRTWLKEQVAHVARMKDAEVAAAAQDRELIGRLLQEVAPDGPKLAERPEPIAAGFIVHGRNKDLDFSVDALMATLRESMVEKVAARLFTDEEK